MIDDLGGIEAGPAQCPLHALGNWGEEGPSASGGVENMVPAPIRATFFKKV